MPWFVIAKKKITASPFCIFVAFFPNINLININDYGLVIDQIALTIAHNSNTIRQTMAN